MKGNEYLGHGLQQCLADSEEIFPPQAHLGTITKAEIIGVIEPF